MGQLSQADYTRRERCELKRYEYKCVCIWGTGEATTRRLNEYGSDGWELVEVIWCWHYFKRDIVETVSKP
jgi:hypothetical protein